MEPLQTRAEQEVFPDSAPERNEVYLLIVDGPLDVEDLATRGSDVESAVKDARWVRSSATPPEARR